MNAITDFLTFQLLITPLLLIVMYYFGAILAPLFSWYFSKWLLKKFVLLSAVSDLAKQGIMQNSQLKHRIYLILIAFLIFIMLEIMWRMMFEFFIAYFQMHEALVNT